MIETPYGLQGNVGCCEEHQHLFRMVVCPVCGNKRCPKATDHKLECTGSNDPGQRGSVYG